jgi:hypothetical protein
MASICSVGSSEADVVPIDLAAFSVADPASVVLAGALTTAVDGAGADEPPANTSS